MLNFSKAESNDILESKLFDEKSFYNIFTKDLERCTKEVIIESPYLTNNRMEMFYPIFQKLLIRGVKIYVITRNTNDHEEENMKKQAESAIYNLERMGVQTLLCVGNHHRKLAILDRQILWEGSLNILSQTYSREIMRRIQSKALALQMFSFLNLGKFL
jgi:phosphatidylserine/phosphatidylglycerophosphate/cardiolipin synthase-like enzyme